MVKSILFGHVSTRATRFTSISTRFTCIFPMVFRLSIDSNNPCLLDRYLRQSLGIGNLFDVLSTTIPQLHCDDAL